MPHSDLVCVNVICLGLINFYPFTNGRRYSFMIRRPWAGEWWQEGRGR